MSVSGTSEKALGLPGAWAMAVGVVIQVAGEWAALSFLIGGLIAWCSGHSYAELTVRRGAPGGSDEFLRDIGQHGLARWLMRVLIAGYMLTAPSRWSTRWHGGQGAYALDQPGRGHRLAGGGGRSGRVCRGLVVAHLTRLARARATA
ncbi:hypothetical protein [Croceicoccus naphthovorans]|uniref:Uncharacterized protein n=1 Tax=Croceicoccus naphthovorans TaxID=1348774 RepID=A0A0G3XIY7_9SPHN|nr:hypothetical protein [Croceicoccus naphthovorans]AKM10571.1 hypothetical protein AB433_12330 [Croceicoccus naphthovorans]MBB3988779.1 hypothetical protein [Croceicoccus naphthovorans]